MRLITKFIEDRKAKQRDKDHLEFIKHLVENDAQWLSSNPIVSRVLKRYKNAIGESWRTVALAPADEFHKEVEELCCEMIKDKRRINRCLSKACQDELTKK